MKTILAGDDDKLNLAVRMWAVGCKDVEKMASVLTDAYRYDRLQKGLPLSEYAKVKYAEALRRPRLADLE